MNLFKMVGEHISKSFVADAEQNLIVLRSTREEMSKLKKRMEEAEVCEDAKQRWEEWKSICESVMRFEQYDNETPFMKYRDCSDILYGKKSSEYGDSILLYAEYLYYLYSADEEPVKLNMAKESCESAIGRICMFFCDEKRFFVQIRTQTRIPIPIPIPIHFAWLRLWNCMDRFFLPFEIRQMIK